MDQRKPLVINVDISSVFDMSLSDLLMALEGRTFQVHQIPGTNMVKLYPVEIKVDEQSHERCPVVLCGHGGAEQCGKRRGHGGIHLWQRGD